MSYENLLHIVVLSQMNLCMQVIQDLIVYSYQLFKNIYNID